MGKVALLPTTLVVVAATSPTVNSVVLVVVVVVVVVTITTAGALISVTAISPVVMEFILGTSCTFFMTVVASVLLSASACAMLSANVLVLLTPDCPSEEYVVDTSSGSGTLMVICATTDP